MTREEARKYLIGKTIKDICFTDTSSGALVDENEIEYIELEDGNRINLVGGYNGEVFASIYYPADGIEEGITE